MWEIEKNLLYLNSTSFTAWTSNKDSLKGVHLVHTLAYDPHKRKHSHIVDPDSSYRLATRAKSTVYTTSIHYRLSKPIATKNKSNERF